MLRHHFSNGFWHFNGAAVVDFAGWAPFHNGMKPIILTIALACLAISGPGTVQAQTNAATAVSADDREQATIDKHLKPILTALQMNDPAKEAKIREIFAPHFKAQTAWHTQNDPQIGSLWNDFNKAHGKKDDAATDAASARIAAIYATFKPEHDKFLAALSTILTPEQVETVKDALTINKVKITFNAYGEIFHGLKDEQKAFILTELKAAREEGIDAANIKEVSAFFKEHKNRIEAYLTAQGYDVKQSYKDFVAKQKADMAGKKSGQPAADQ
jgi:hypothetical protein